MLSIFNGRFCRTVRFYESNLPRGRWTNSPRPAGINSSGRTNPADLAARFSLGTPITETYYVDAVALNLHGFYAGLERILEVIADGIDQSKPAGANWHRALIQQLTVEIRGIRPAVLSAATRDRLDRYRGFRHVVRHVYTFNLDPQQIELLIQHLPATMAQVSQELMAFADVLEAIALAES